MLKSILTGYHYFDIWSLVLCRLFPMKVIKERGKMINSYKKNGIAFGLLMFAFLVLALTVAVPASAQVPADLCLKVTIQEDEKGPVVPVKRFAMNVHLESVDEIHFTIWGKVAILKEPFYIGGTGVLEGNFLTMNLTTSQKHLDGWMDSGVMQARFNISTGYGTFYEIGHDFDRVNRVFDERYTAGVLRLCP